MYIETNNEMKNPDYYQYMLHALPQSHTCENILEIPNYCEAFVAQVGPCYIYIYIYTSGNAS